VSGKPNLEVEVESKSIKLEFKVRSTLSQKRQISENIREKVSWKENFPVIRGNDD
jgi:hypothetical protein